MATAVLLTVNVLERKVGATFLEGPDAVKACALLRREAETWTPHLMHIAVGSEEIPDLPSKKGGKHAAICAG